MWAAIDCIAGQHNAVGLRGSFMFTHRSFSCTLFGQVTGPGHVGKPRIWSDVVLSDIHHLSVSRPYQVAHNKSAWRAQTCSTRT